jgi:hypothetical protein
MTLEEALKPAARLNSRDFKHNSRPVLRSSSRPSYQELKEYFTFATEGSLQAVKWTKLAEKP